MKRKCFCRINIVVFLCIRIIFPFFYMLPISLHLRKLLNLQSFCYSGARVQCVTCAALLYICNLLNLACKKIIDYQNENKWRENQQNRLQFVHSLASAGFKRYVYFLWKFTFFCFSANFRQFIVLVTACCCCCLVDFLRVV